MGFRRPKAMSRFEPKRKLTRLHALFTPPLSPSSNPFPAPVAACVLIARAGFEACKRRAARASRAKGLVLLADAIVVEQAAKALLADDAEALALHDAGAPIDMSQIGYGKGLLAARIAVSEAIWAQRQLEYGEDFIGANSRLNLAKRAYAIAHDMATQYKPYRPTSGPGLSAGPSGRGDSGRSV